MRQGAIRKEDLKDLVAAARNDGAFYGPVRGADGVSLCEVGPQDEVTLDYFNFRLPAKVRFFPRSELICTYDGEEVTDILPAADGAVVFGVRPCDALSLRHLEKVFLDEKFVDPYYRARREATLIVSLACTEPLATCFCTSVGGSPTGADGADIVAFDVGESLLFDAVTEKGEAFMASHSGLFAQVTASALRARDEQATEVAGRVPKVDVAGIAEKLEASFDSPIWDEMARRCLGCGVCTYLCPTCHCFGLCDEGAGPKGSRIRVQDSCMFPSFTLEASGHNPRSSNGERMRQRVMHKFRYTVENFGDIFCVGCGRCVGNCPVNVDIREALAEVVK